MQIKKKIRRITDKYQRLFKYFLKTTKKGKVNPDVNTAVVHLDSFLLNKDRGRYSFIICQILKFSGYDVVVKMDRRFFLKEGPYKTMLLAQDFTYVRTTRTKVGTIEIYGKDLKRRSIKLHYGFKLINNEIAAYYLPYTLHPRFYLDYTGNTNFQVFRETERKTRIIFAGNFERELYARAILKDNFEGIISRVDVLDYIKASYANDSRVVYSPTKEDLYALLVSKPSVNKLVLSDVKTPEADWLSILSKADFYLCLPGMAMPWSHNAFESMAVGTIPIIQYNYLFYPHLVHLENCIAYDSFDSFDEAIELALNMTVEQVSIMKQKVIEYFDKYLSTERTINKIQSFVGGEQETMTIAMPFIYEKQATKNFA